MALELEEHMIIVENGVDANEKKMVCDSSLDHKGRLPLRFSTGTWKAALFIIGTGGHKPSLESFGADQFDDNNLEERKGKMSFFNWWNATLCSSLILSVTVLTYVEDNSGWGIANLILTVTMFITITIFYLGKPFYRYRVPQGSPLTPILQVFVAAMMKRNQPYPSSQDSFYEPESPQGKTLCHTNNHKFLDKACIVKDNEIIEGKKPSPWKLTTVTKVEETKLLVNIVPIWLASLLYGLFNAQGATFFVKQSSTMDRKMGSFTIPPASIQVLFAFGMLFCVICYDKIITPILRRKMGNERGIPILQRVGVGMFLSILIMIVAALVEKQRLITAEKEKSKVLSMSVFWLAPQYFIMGIADAFSLVGLQEFFYGQVPDSMRSIGIALYLSVIGVGSFLSSFLITVVNQVTEKTGKRWIGKDLSSSRLDKFYWLLAAINGLNFGIYVLLAKRYSYKNVLKNVAVTIEAELGHAYDRPQPRETLVVSLAEDADANTPQQVHISLVGEDRMRISWITDDHTPPVVYYSITSGKYDHTANGNISSYDFVNYTSGQIHDVVIGPLDPSTVYYYCFAPGSTHEYSFKTPPAQFPIKFAVSGDLGQTGWTKSTLEHISQSNYDVFLLPGDLCYADTVQPLWDSFGRLVEPLASQRPWMVTQGNHDIEQTPNIHMPPFTSYNARWRMPFEESGSTSNLYYAFEVSGVHVIMLGSYTDFGPGSDQYEWLESDLRKVDRTKTPWLVVLVHAPWYNTNYAHQGEIQSVGMMESMEGLLYKARVDVVLAGHVHAYERFHRVYNQQMDNCGPVHITIGDGGNLHGLVTTYKEPQATISAFREASFGHGELEMVNASYAKWSWHRNDDDESVQADMVLIKSLASDPSCIKLLV
ncbi:purple acid phosphatases superfamily protein [Artemisia annua]|uniref:Purple acid phosphatase n=1 Tax=Artemisia annua TaxID=35608 RepID=A0A2U1LRL8_ARTAN|nr:purple acid phosphatases superfamily protein [Artemisia annua]